MSNVVVIVSIYCKVWSSEVTFFCPTHAFLPRFKVKKRKTNLYVFF